MKQTPRLLIALIFMSFFFITFYSQLTIASNTPMVIAENSEMNIHSGIITFGSIENRATSFISGDCNNMVLYTGNSDRVVSNELTQTLYHNSKTFNNLVIANAKQPGDTFNSIGNTNTNSELLPNDYPLTESIFSVGQNDSLSIEIMNIITPNGDGINDVLYISNIDVFPDNEVIIINQAGSIVFSAKNYDNTWDTSVNGKFLPAGDYICILRIQGHSKVYKQMISVLR